MVRSMKTVFLWCFSCVLLVINSCALLADDEEFEIAKSLPDEVSALQTIHDFQIGGLVSPISGNPYLQETDLVARGAEEIVLNRVFLSPSLPTSFDSRPTVDDYVLHEYLNQYYKGWINFPHTHLEYSEYFQGKIRLTMENGASIDFRKANDTFVLNDNYGISNLGPAGPSGEYDLRNITFAINGDSITVNLPDGTIRYYIKDPLLKKLAPKETWVHCIYRLEKEIRPNGKVWLFSYDENESRFGRKLIKVESTSPDGQIVYASISINRDPLPNCDYKDKDYRDMKTTRGMEKCIRQEINTVFTTNSGQTATYQHEVLKKLLFFQKERYKVTSPLILKVASSPYGKKMSTYNAHFLIKNHESNDRSFACTYKGFTHQKKQIDRIHTISFPTQRTEIGYEVAHTIDYDIPTAGKKRGITKVINSDGSSLVYHISEDLLIDKIQYFNQKGSLHKQTNYSWDSNQRCRSIEYCDENLTPIYSIHYEFDAFGNPIQEIIQGNITGEGGLQSKIIEREYSQDGRNLLLSEKIGAVEKCYQYLPRTNLLTQKLTLVNSQIYKRELFNYDACFNLIEEIVDNGTSENSLDCTGVTKRTFKRYQLRTEAPFIHMPEWIIEGASENGQDRILKKTHCFYDVFGNVCQEDVYNADLVFAYSIYKTYNERGNLLSETNPLGQKAEYSYDKRGNRITEVPFSQKQYIENTYDKRNLLINRKTTGSDGQVHAETYIYDQKERLIKSTNYLGHVTNYTYPVFCRKAAEKRLPYISAVADSEITKEIQTLHDLEKVLTVIKENSTYDAFDNLLTDTDANGNRTSYINNVYGSPLQILHPNHGLESFRYDLQGRLINQVDQEGNRIDFLYDGLGRILKKSYTYKNGLTASESFEYDSWNLVKEIDKEGNVKSIGYDFAGRKSSEEFCGRRVEWKYDTLGRVDKVIKFDPKNTLAIEYQRDLAGRVLVESRSDLAGNILYKISYTYDPDGNVSEKTRYIHNEPATEYFSYDSFNRLISYRDACGSVTNYSYNENYFKLLQRVLQKITVDPENNQIVETYNAQDNLVKIEKFNPNRQLISSKELLYDACGNVVSELDYVFADGNLIRKQVIVNKYNSLNLLEQMVQGVNTDLIRTTTFSYDPCGRMEIKVLPSGVALTFSYAQAGLLSRIVSSDNSIHHSYQYNLNGDLLTAVDHANGIVVEREVDSFGNTLKERFSTGFEIAKTYDNFNRILSLTIPQQGAVYYAYDPLYLKSVTRRSFSDVEIFHHRYLSYDLNGDLLEEQLPNELGTVSYTYDQKGRQKTLNSPYISESYEYNANGNLISRNTDQTDDVFAYDALNQLVLEKIDNQSLTYEYDSLFNRIRKNGNAAIVNALNELQEVEGTTFQYDLNGNQSQKTNSTETFTYSYDALNRLILAQNEQKQVRFVYDPAGRCLTKVVLVPSLGEWIEASRENYLYDGIHEIGAFDRDNNPKQLRLLGQRPNNIVASTVVVEIENEPFSVINDFHGNALVVVDIHDRSRIGKYRFTAYGETSKVDTEIFNPWAYASKRLDLDLQLINFGKRFYDPKIGRWITHDPAGKVDSTNLYQYLLNNPHLYSDPEGKYAIPFPLIVQLSGTFGLGMTLALPSLPVIATAFVIAGGTWMAYEAIDYLNENKIFDRLYSDCQSDIEMQKRGKKKKEDYRQKEKDGVVYPDPPFGDELWIEKPKDQPPTDKYKWQGEKPPGGKQGNWVNPEDGSYLRPDLDHSDPIGPHFDYVGPNYPPKGIRIFPNGDWGIK